VSANGRALAAGDANFEIETYGETTSYVAREYSERSERLLRAHAFDTLNEQARGQVMEWLSAEMLSDIVFASH
jgi:hypothetical protein